jgi:uncharacterized membrane protein
MITLRMAYAVAGLLFAAFAALSALDRSHGRRWGNAVFWGLVAASFLAGDRIGDFGNGLLILALAAIAGFGLTGQGPAATTTPEQRAARAGRYGARLFLPALVIPAVAIFGSLVLKHATLAGRPLLEPGQATLVSLTLGAIGALVLGMAMFRPPPLAPLQEGRRLADTVGWAGLLPQALAALGAVFALAGVGPVVGELIGRAVPLDSRFAVVAAYTLGMAGFTAIMGNAFAAFPVMTAAIGLPLIVHRFGGDPAIMGAIGMLSGFCGTLTTPMAANFNLVPVRLLELPDRWAVIRAQAPTALMLLAVNTALMYLLVFRF